MSIASTGHLSSRLYVYFLFSIQFSPTILIIHHSSARCYICRASIWIWWSKRGRFVGFEFWLAQPSDVVSNVFKMKIKDWWYFFTFHLHSGDMDPTCMYPKMNTNHIIRKIIIILSNELMSSQLLTIFFNFF